MPIEITLQNVKVAHFEIHSEYAARVSSSSPWASASPVVVDITEVKHRDVWFFRAAYDVAVRYYMYKTRQAAK